jgi:N-carbamoylputrescine amidase
MKKTITVCELRDDRDGLQKDLSLLCDHVNKTQSDLVLLPEMGLSPWFAWRKEFNESLWNKAVADHDETLHIFSKLKTAAVLGSRPVNLAGKRLNEAFVIEPDGKYRMAHHKYYVPGQEGYWEANWYHRGEREFKPLTVNDVMIGFAICSDIWFFENLRAYGKMGAHIVACPRATPESKYDKWLAGGRVAGVVSGAFSISSCKTNTDKTDVDLGGHGWIADPEGVVLGQTSKDEPFLTLEIDLDIADRSKKTYPRYISD